MDPNEASEMVTGLVETAGNLIIEYGLSVIGAIVVFIIGRGIAGWARTKEQCPHEGRYGRVADPLLLEHALLLDPRRRPDRRPESLQDRDDPLIAVFGTAGLAVGLALQGTLELLRGRDAADFRPIRVSDFVEVAGQAGTVKEIAIFSTIMHTGDNVRIVIPNGAVYGDIVKNYPTTKRAGSTSSWGSATATTSVRRSRSSRG